MVNAGFIVDGEQKESIKQHLLANKSVPSDFWSNVERLSGFKSRGILTDGDFPRELGSMVGELVKGGQTRLNLEVSVTSSFPSSVPNRPAKRIILKGKKEAAKATANTRGGNIINCWIQVTKEPVSGSSRLRGI